MPGIINPFSLGSGGPATHVSEPWGEIYRVSTVVGGKITFSGLDLSSMIAVQLVITGLTITTDDSQILLRFIVAGSEITTGYRSIVNRSAPAVDALTGTNAGTSIPLSYSSVGGSVGNASVEAFGGTVTIFAPATTLHKRCSYRSAWATNASGIYAFSNAGAQLDNSGTITGFVVYATSDIIAGTIILLGLE